jgi:amino acid transporter
MIYLVGTDAGRNAIDDTVKSLGLNPIPWATYHGGFDTLFAGTAPVFWAFFLLTGISVFVLRAKDPDIARPFRLRVPWYPLLPLIFCATCVFGFYSAITYAKYVSMIGWVPLICGLPLYFLSGHSDQATRPNGP